MLAYIKGELAIKARGYVVIDVGGVGYKILMSEFAIENIGNITDEVKVFTYYRVMEDDISLFGFLTSEELHLFEHLISVSGVGAKTALALLGCLEPSDFAIAIISEDINTLRYEQEVYEDKLKKLPGIGAKTAQRIVLELKDKLKKEQTIDELSLANKNIKTLKKKEKNPKEDEAISALQVLGYNNREIEKVIESIDTEGLTLEEIIKIGLKKLAIK